MDSWILKGVKNLINEPQSVNISSPTQIKVKVSHLLLTEMDEMVFNGEIGVNYPRIPGRCAIGIVTEAGENCYGLQKGTRVYFEPTRACGNCLPCKTGKSKSCSSVVSAGIDFDGFMRDFVVCEYTDVSPLPDSVDEFHALCIETVAIAENIYDKLNLSAGQRVAVIGGDIFGIIVAQIMLYHKVIPIIVDNNPSSLEKAKKCGIYYAFTTEDGFEENINSATSGNLCDAAVYCASTKLPLSLAARLVATGKTLVLGCNSAINATISAKDVLRKNLTVIGVCDAYDYTAAAINIIVHGALNLDYFEKSVLTEYNPAAILSDGAQCPSAKKNKMTIFKMIL